MDLAPIALFTYKRLDHTRKTVESLQRNEYADRSELFAFSDGPRDKGDCANVAAVREYLKSISGFGRVTIIEREKNLGLAQSIITGVNEIVGRFGRVIVLEDDMVSSPYFLRYMNEALDMYEEEDKVVSIHGYVYPVKGPLPETFFLRGADCWGWATWKRGWDLFETDGKVLLEEIRRRNLQRVFDYDGSYPYTSMLEDQIAGRNDSWAIRWHASAFLRERLTLFPGRSLVRNIGTDDSGTHFTETKAYDIEVAAAPLQLARIPLEENAEVRRKFKLYFLSMRHGVFGRFTAWLLQFLG